MGLGDIEQCQQHPPCMYQPCLLPKLLGPLRRYREPVAQIPTELNQHVLSFVDGFWEYDIVC